MNFLANLLQNIGKISSSFGTNACFVFFADEHICPKSLLK